MSNPEAEFELTERQRAFATRLANNPLDLYQGKTLGWLEDFIRITVGNIVTRTGPGAQIGTHTVGHMAWICKDLSANVNEFVYEDDSGQYLYLNGAAVSQTTYADLYEFYGPNAYGTDSGGLFLLPDSRGRSAFLCGTHSNTDLGDHDGISLSLRQALHQHSVTGTVASHTHDDGTLTVASHTHGAGSFTAADHSHSSAGSSSDADYSGANNSFVVGQNDLGDQNLLRGSGALTVSGTSGAASPDVTGSTGSASPAVTGTAGSGMAADGPAHIYIGSLLVRF